MSQARQITVVCAGVLVLSALTSTLASAATAGWMVNGTMLTGSAAVATVAAVDQVGVLEGGGVTITCTGKTLNSITPEIKSPTKAAANTVEFTGCKAAEPCTLAAEKINTDPVLEEATLEGVLALIGTLKPEVGTVFTTIKFSGAECGLSGTTPIKGEVKVLEPTGQDERTLQLSNLITTAASGVLELGSSAASLSGSALFELAHGELWSFL
jgi:hypothetical protein